MSEFIDCYIGLGSNLGSRASYIRRAIFEISHRITKITAKSFLYESAPWGSFEGETFPYLNAVVLLKTEKSAHEVLDLLQAVENDLGRTRSLPNAPRTIDLDLLFYGNEIIKTERLTVPHPHLSQRRFVLQPLCDISPFFIHPSLGLTAQELLESCQDSQQELPRV